MLMQFFHKSKMQKLFISKQLNLNIVSNKFEVRSRVITVISINYLTEF